MAVTAEDKYEVEEMIRKDKIKQLSQIGLAQEDVLALREENLRNIRSQIFGGLAIENNTVVSYIELEPPENVYFYGLNGGVDSKRQARPIRVELLQNVNTVKDYSKDVAEKVQSLAMNIEMNSHDFIRKNRTNTCAISDILGKEFSNTNYKYKEVTQQELNRIVDTLSQAYDRVSMRDDFYTPDLDDAKITQATCDELRRGYMDKVSLSLSRKDMYHLTGDMVDSNGNDYKLELTNRDGYVLLFTAPSVVDFVKDINAIDMKSGVENVLMLYESVDFSPNVKFSYKGKEFQVKDASKIAEMEKQDSLKSMLTNRFRPARSVERIDEVLKGKRTVDLKNFRSVGNSNGGVSGGR